MLLISKTEKLFFNKYTHKLAVHTPLAGYFRSKKFKETQLLINELSEKFDMLKVSRIKVNKFRGDSISVRELFTAQRLLDVLRASNEDYHLRVESDHLGIYTSSSEFLDSIFKIKDIQLVELSRPEDEQSAKLLLEGHNLIIKKSYEYKYKVAVKALYNDGEAFVKWASTMNNIKTSSSRSYKWGGNFYVKDDKTLTVCRLYLGDKIIKINEFVTKDEN